LIIKLVLLKGERKMRKEIISVVILTVLMLNMFKLAFNIPNVATADSNEFLATAYYCVYESEMDGAQKVTLTISGKAYTLKASFLFGGFGVAMQGTGRTGPGGDYIHYDGGGGGWAHIDNPQEFTAEVRQRYVNLGITDFTGFGNLALTHPEGAKYSVVSGVIGSSGRTLVAWYSIAVDPSVISLGTIGTLLFMSGTTPDGAVQMRFRADDSGGRITGNRIDIYVGEGLSALNEWIQTGGNRYVKVLYGWGKSHNVAVIDDYYGSAVGYLYPSDYPGQTFSTLSASQVSAQALVSYDTVIIFMFDPSQLSSTQKSAIISWVFNGGKLLIWDSDQVPPGSPWDYTWLPYPFTTSTPGQTGACTGKLEIMEENQLASSDPSSSYYIDTNALVHNTDAVGDATVLTTYSSGWRIAMMATNVLGETGPTLVYASYGSGLIIYSALDWDYAGYWSGWDWSKPGVWLKKLLKQQLDCSYLPFVAPPVPGEVGLEVEVTPEAPEGYYVGKPINFKVTVTNPTGRTGINIIVYNVQLNMIVPEEIEVTTPTASIGNIAPGESKTTTFSGAMKKAGINIEVIVNARGEDHALWKTIAGSDSCTIEVYEPEEPKPSWSFAIITDLHIGYGSKVADWDNDGELEIDYDGRSWDDDGLGDIHSYGLAETLIYAIQTIIDAKDVYNIRFVVVLGDISDTAEKSEFLTATEILNRLNDPNGDGNTDDGIPYVPIFGNHDTLPYTQDSGDPNDRTHYDTKAPYAKGDQFFQEIFWDQNPTNNKLILRTLKEWKKQSMPIYSWILRHDIYLQNYAFSYWESENQEDKINFVCLDVVERLTSSPIAKYWKQTKDFLVDYLKEHSGQKIILFSHHPLYGLGGFLDTQDVAHSIVEYGCSGALNFAGHNHRNHIQDVWVCDWRGKPTEYAYTVIETEALSQIPIEFSFRGYPIVKSTQTGECIRIVQKKGTEIDYSVTLKPKRVIDILWPSPFFTYTYASYPEPNQEITFTAYYTSYHGFKVSFYWEFGDGTFGAGSSVKHSYSEEGEYTVTLTVTIRNLITGEERSQTVTGSVYVHSKHVISHLPPDLHATSLLTLEDLTQIPKNTYQPTLITKSGPEEIPIAELGVHFEEATEDINFSNMISDIDLGESKSVIWMPTWPEEIEEYKVLFIPSTGAGTVYICLNATLLNEVSLENADLIINVGETKDNITVTTTFYNGREYYLVSGITNAGGGELKDVVPPTTTLTIGEPKYVTDITYVTPETPFSLNATDNPGGTGVALTAYRIRKATYDSGWLPYTEPFHLVGLADGTYSIDYNSTDNAHNVEPTHTINVTLFSWNYIFEDTYGRGTILKINLAHKFFQFTTPDKDYGIREATYMRQCGRAIIIHHYDDELRLITTAVDTKLDFCVAIAWDTQTGKRYFLIDKAGTE
jgi:3D (Asp-Asp-Asp) domain-containing protein